MPREARPGRWKAGGSTVAERPELAIKIAVVANTWTLIEGHLAFALGAMIGTDPQVALAILSKVQTATAKSQMLRAIGKGALDPRVRPTLESLLSAFETLAKRRNKVVHGLWGTLDAEPDGLLWIPADAPANISLRLTSAMKPGDPQELMKDALAGLELWEGPDFDELCAELDQLASRSVHFATRMQVLATARQAGFDVESLLSKWSATP